MNGPLSKVVNIPTTQSWGLGAYKFLWRATGWPINIKPHKNSYTEGCVKMRALQQWNKLFIVNLSLFWGTVCICRPTLKKDIDHNVLPVIFQYSHQT